MDGVSTRSGKLMPPHSKARNGAGRHINPLGKVAVAVFQSQKRRKNRTAGDECCVLDGRRINTLRKVAAASFQSQKRSWTAYQRARGSCRRLIPKPETEKNRTAGDECCGLSTRSGKLLPPHSKARNGVGRRINELGKVDAASSQSQRRRKTEQQVMNVAGESA